MFVQQQQAINLGDHGRMSLVSATGVVGGIKEYTIRGIQQLPIILGSTSLLFTIATGSIAHANMVIGLGIVAPLYTYVLQMILTSILDKFAPKQKLSWTRSTSPVCNILTSYDPQPVSFYSSANQSAAQSVPSYWLMEVAFFIGYALSNAIDSLQTPAQANSDPQHIEKRNSSAIFLIVALAILSVLVLFVRFSVMRGCEGNGTLGIILSIVAAFGASGIGYSMYRFSRQCGSRSSDLFGILSQILPASSTSQNPAPVVCSAD